LGPCPVRRRIARPRGVISITARSAEMCL
jgi:hypothetical protein